MIKINAVITSMIVVAFGLVSGCVSTEMISAGLLSPREMGGGVSKGNHTHGVEWTNKLKQINFASTSLRDVQSQLGKPEVTYPSGMIAYKVYDQRVGYFLRELVVNVSPSKSGSKANIEHWMKKVVNGVAMNPVISNTEPWSPLTLDEMMSNEGIKKYLEKSRSDLRERKSFTGEFGENERLMNPETNPMLKSQIDSIREKYTPREFTEFFGRPDPWNKK